jgi:hypothetical protein
MGLARRGHPQGLGAVALNFVYKIKLLSYFGCVMATFDEYMKRVSDQVPDLWRALYPRAYEVTSQYGSTKLPAITLMANAISPIDAHGRKVLYAQTCMLLQGAVPTYFITRDLVFALSKTELPLDYELKDFEMKWPAVLFMLPRDMMVDENGLDHPYLLLSHQLKPEEFQLQFPSEKYTPEQIARSFPTVLSKSCGITVTTSAYAPRTTDGDSRLTTYNYSVIPAQHPTLGEAFQLDESENYRQEREAWLKRTVEKVGETELHTLLNQPLSQGESNFSKSCLTLAMKIALFMESKKELVEMGKPKKTFHRKERRPDIFYPNIVGKSYRIRYVYEKDEQDVPEHQKHQVRFHWRNGHYRWQRFGKGRSERKRILIEGLFVGTKLEQ